MFFKILSSDSTSLDDHLTTFCPPEGWDEQQWLMKAQDLLKSYGIDPCLGNLSWKSFTSPKISPVFLGTVFFVGNLMTIT